MLDLRAKQRNLSLSGTLPGAGEALAPPPIPRRPPAPSYPLSIDQERIFFRNIVTLPGRTQAGQIVKQIAPIVGGGGGGRPDFAEAGGRQPEKIDEMLDAAERVLEQLLTQPSRA